jgi:hypothetical protein
VIIFEGQYAVSQRKKKDFIHRLRIMQNQCGLEIRVIEILTVKARFLEHALDLVAV